MQTDQGAWVASEREWVDQLRSRKATARTLLRLDPTADAPWSAILKLEDQLRAWGFEVFSYMAPCFPLDGPVVPGAVTESEAAELARTIDQAFRDGDAEVFDRALYRDEMLRRTLGSTRLTTGVRACVGSSLQNIVFSGQQARDAAGQTPALRFLSIRIAEGDPRPLFRLLLPNRLDYLEFVLGKTSEGKTRIVDVYSTLYGELATETLRSTVLDDPASLAIANQLRAPTPGDLALCIGKASHMTGLFLDNKPKEALQFFKENAREFKTSKVAYRIRFTIAQQVGMDEYLKALEDFERDFPQDPSLTFRRVERRLLTKDREKGLEAIDALDRAVKGDPYLNVLRAQLHLDVKDFAKARACAEKATRDEPGLDRGWWTAISVCLAQKDFAETAKLLSAAEKALKITLGDLRDVSEFEEFVKSSEYKEWIRSRK
jgi:tetratricopeptide (TPR) repeat protein